MCIANVLQLLDRFGTVVASARVTEEKPGYGGTIDLMDMPVDMRQLFEEFEEIVNGQMFSFLDEIQEKIAALPLKAVFEDGREASLQDLQIYPGTGEVSFKLTAVAPLRSAST